MDLGGDAQKLEQIRRRDIAERAKHHGGDGDHHHGLCRDVVHHLLAARAHILRDQRGVGHSETGAKRDDQERHREADRDGGDRGSAEPSDPERVDQLIAGLECVAENDRDRERDQGRRDRTFQQPAAALGDNCVSLLQRCGLSRGAVGSASSPIGKWQPHGATGTFSPQMPSIASRSISRRSQSSSAAASSAWALASSAEATAKPLRSRA